MGYTHYWYRKPKIEQPQFDLILSDFQKVLPHLDVKLGDAYGENEPEITVDAVVFNGVGNDAHETFAFEIEEQPYRGRPDADGLVFNFTKTAAKPYDIAVTTFLIIAKKYLGDKIKVASDGDNEDWADAKRICQEFLGYGEKFTFEKSSGGDPYLQEGAA